MDSIQMEPVGKFKTDRNGSAKGGAWRVVAEQDVDDVAFLTDQQDKSSSVAPPGGAPIAVCSQRKALWLAAFVFSAIFGSALVLAYAGPASNCPCPHSGLSDLNWAIGQTGNNEGSQSGSSAVRLATNGAVFPWKGNRLPMNVVPLNYRLWLHPNLTTGDLKGEVSIDLRVERETSFIVLNCRHLILTEKAISSGTKTVSIAKVLYYPQADQVYIEIKDKFKRRSNYTLSLRFTGRLNMQEQRGLYLVNNDDSALAASRFWLRGARSAFPCFDEPSMRATFSLTIVRDRFHVSLTNSPVVATEEAGFYLGHRLLQDEFGKTPPLSSYMLSIVVCSLSRINTKYVSRSPNTLELIAAQNNQSEVKYVPVVNMTGFNVTMKTTYVSLYGEQKLLDSVGPTLEWVSQTLQSFEQKLNFTYPLQKLDIVCSEGVSSSSGEGGWGLIVVSPYSLTNTRVMARMIAHQWFGGLVSPRWWNSLWLMEAMVNVLVEKAPSYSDVAKGYKEPKSSESGDVAHKLILEHILPALRLDASDAPIAGGQIPNYNSASSSKTNNQARLDRPDLDLVSDDLAVHKGAAVVGMALWAGGAIRGNGANPSNHSTNITNGNSVHNGFAKFLRYIPNFAGGSSGTILALARFLKRRALSTAEPKDLWAAAAPKTLPSDCWDSWSEQPGYPLVTITRRGKDLVISQERFLLTASPPDWLSGNSERMVTSQLISDSLLEGSSGAHTIDEDNEGNSTVSSLLDDANTTTFTHTTPQPTPKPRRKGPHSVWTVPLALKLGPLEDLNATVNPLYYDINESKESELFVWMNETEVVLEGLGSVAYVKCNIGGRALYRCFVSDDLDYDMSKSSEKDSFNSAEAALRLDDMFILAINGRISPMKALTIAARSLTTDETVPAPVKAVAVQRLTSLRSIMCKSIASTAFDSFLKKVAGIIVKNNKLSLRNSDRASSIDSILMLAAVRWGDPKLTEEATALFKVYSERNISIPDNIYEAVLTGAVITDKSHLVWNKIWNSLLLPLIDKRETSMDSKMTIVSIDPLSIERDQFGVKCLYGQCSDDKLLSTLRALATTKDDWLLDRYIHAGARLGSSVVVQERENRTNFYHNINILSRDVICQGHSSFAFTRAALTEATALTLHAVNATRSALKSTDDPSTLLKNTLRLRKRLEGLRRAVVELCECAKTEYEYYEASQLLSLVGDQGGRGASALRRSASNVQFVADHAEQINRNLPNVL